MTRSLTTTNTVTNTNSSITDELIERWLDNVQRSKSNSAKTRKAYSDTLVSFRHHLQEFGVDLGSQDTAFIADKAEAWATLRSPRSRWSGEIADATYNQRLNIVSSFYGFVQSQAKRRGLEIPENPMQHIDRRRVDPYSGAEALGASEVAERLAAINRATLKGKRDYALLSVGFQTCRRANELVTLRMKNLRIRGNIVTINFDNCKGGKKMRDTLDLATSKVLLSYLKEIYGARPQDTDPEAAVWVSLARVNRGEPIGYHTLADICALHLESTRTHLIRHSGAVASHRAGATTNDVKERLGHSNVSITDRYLHAVTSDVNEYGAKTAESFGIGKKKR